MRTRCSQLEITNADLSRQNKRLNSENHFLAEVNEAFANENDELRDSVEYYTSYRLPKSLRQQEPDDNRPSKHPKTTKSKGKKPVRVTDDELEYDSNSEEQEEHEPDELNVKEPGFV